MYFGQVKHKNEKKNTYCVGGSSRNIYEITILVPLRLISTVPSIGIMETS